MKSNGLVDGLLPTKEYKGWIHNPVVTKKSWSSEDVRINIDTKRMNNQLILPFWTGQKVSKAVQVPQTQWCV